MIPGARMKGKGKDMAPYHGFLRIVLSVLLIVVSVALCAEIAMAIPSKSPATEVHRFAIPDKAWALEVALPAGLSDKDPGPLKEEQLEGDEPIFFAVVPKDGWHISVSMTRAADGVDARTAREEYGASMAKSPLRIENIKEYEVNGGLVWEHLNKDPRFIDMKTGKVAVSKALMVFLVHDDWLIKVSLHKLSFKKADQRSFESVPASVRIVPCEPGSACR